VTSFLSYADAQNSAYAQNRECPIRGFYSIGYDGCYHRYPSAVLQGCKERKAECPRAERQPTPVSYITATPSQVAAAIVCDIAAAAHATKNKGKAVDFSKAVITGDITFNLVTKTSSGASLKVPAIPVFSSVSAAPSLDAKRITSDMTQFTTSITVDPAELHPCTHASGNNWLTSQVILEPIKGMRVTKVSEALAFVVTNQKSAGLNLNIIPISIGPQFSTETTKTQKACLLFDFAKSSPPEKPTCPTVSASN
jgi:hypothetical protein